MSDASLVAGDDQVLTVDLYTDDDISVGDISAATSVQVALCTSDRKTVVCGPYTAVSSHPSAAWAGSSTVAPRVAITVPGTDTAAKTVRDFQVEVQVIIAGLKGTYYGKKRVQLVRGAIP
jgi:hypothetical protein